jgi:hypothetical protein
MFEEILKKLTVTEIKDLIKTYNLHTRITMTKNKKPKTKADLIKEILLHADYKDNHVVLKDVKFEKNFEVDRVNNMLKKKPFIMQQLKNLAEGKPRINP